MEGCVRYQADWIGMFDAQKICDYANPHANQWCKQRFRINVAGTILGPHHAWTVTSLPFLIKCCSRRENCCLDKTTVFDKMLLLGQDRTATIFRATALHCWFIFRLCTCVPKSFYTVLSLNQSFSSVQVTHLSLFSLYETILQKNHFWFSVVILETI